MKYNKPLQVILRAQWTCRLMETQSDRCEDDPSLTSFSWQAAVKTV